MSRICTTTVICDRKECGKKLVLGETVEETTPGAENIVAITVSTGVTYYFCCMMCLISFAVAWVKALSIDANKESKAHRAMEELETIPPMEDLGLR